MGKTLIFTFLAVIGGIYLYSRYRKTGTIRGTLTFGDLAIKPAEGEVFYGPYLDPVTGSYLGPGAQPGTVAFPVQSVP